jgi:tRNA 2-thiocytidine biosynthesis protein TtcA
LVEQLQEEIPQIKNSLLNAMRNVQPRHLLDKNLKEF